MIAKRHLNNAPIKEAIIDIQVTRDGEFDLNSIEGLHAQFKEEYPHIDPLTTNKLGFHFDSNKSMSTKVDSQQAGYRYTSKDKKNIVQYRKDGFTFSRLEPYETWEIMSAEAKKLWEIYKQSCSDNCLISRIATRYINLMMIPLPIEDFSAYLASPPTVPPGLPQGISSFLSRVVIPNPEIKAHVIITHALDRPEEDFAPITLDIDAVKQCEYDPQNTNIWLDLDKLRSFKNDVFFESITEKSAELFK
ncbi:MAG: TIGR04255 family protein [Candidatus Thiodiazotropha sp.]